MEILRLVGRGSKRKNLPRGIDLSMKTVEFYGRQAYLKIGVTGGIGAVRFANREGYMKA